MAPTFAPKTEKKCPEPDKCTNVSAIRKWNSKRPSRFTSNVVKVLVGENEEAFTVHEGHLTSTSDLFHRMLHGGGAEFKERIEGVVKLPECSPETFSQYMEYLYFGHLFTNTTEDKLHYAEHMHGEMFNDVVADESNKEYAMLCELIAFGDYVQDDDLYNAAIEAFIDVHNVWGGIPKPAIVTTAYQKLEAGSSFIRLLQDIYVDDRVMDAMFAVNNYTEDNVPPNLAGFWFNVALKRTKYMDSSNPRTCPWKKDSCQYHRHKDAEKCEAKVNENEISGVIKT
ncbi:hypothetical protein BT63DRAFT_426920 [Microthyrium microscopicum]|uniref:BTB domain-containing protein n=1 Tax=Microthyrium microscopicum TaxID=703497 RepID=A0A6A6UB03_9PEZI|nr:hypothetical protein BT63DRAFT_426920 [Microthyrium microscopicum]